jgi:hypothetical protein
MKFLEYTPLSRVSAFLQRVNLGDCVVQGEIQAYSCALLRAVSPLPENALFVESGVHMAS